MRHGLLVQSFSRFSRVGYFDPATGVVEALSRKAAGLSDSAPIAGHFGRLGGRRIVLFRDGGALALRVDDRAYGITADTQARLERGWLFHTLTLHHGGAVVLSITYRRPFIFPPLSWDFTPFAEEEHFDFGLFLYNVIASPERQAVYGTGR